jgi:GNAT superfamily N-acetyltransferase
MISIRLLNANDELVLRSIAPASHRGQGIGRSLVAALVVRARELNCTEAWVLTDSDNASAMRMYAAGGGYQDGKPQVMFTFAISLPRHRIVP